MSALPFFYEPATKRFYPISGVGNLEYSAEELKAGLSEWAGMVDEIVKTAEPPAEPESPAEPPVPPPGAEPLPTP
jgi:hypothetical protein